VYGVQDAFGGHCRRVSVVGLSCQVVMQECLAKLCFGWLLNEQCIYFVGELGEIEVFEF